MCQYVVLILFAVSIYLVSAPAWGELPSLMSDKPARPPATRLASTGVRPARLLGVESPFKGTLSFYSVGDLDYRFNRRGMKASFKRGTASFDTSIGYGGNRRLEMNWRTGGGRLKFAVGADEHENGYRLEFTRDF